MNKKEILLDLINQKKVNSCTIMGVPTPELRDCMINGKNIMSLFESKGIHIPFELDPDGFEHTFINVYMARTKNIYCINISEKVEITTDLIENIIKTFFVEVIDIYQFDILPHHIELILNNDKISFNDILMYLCRKKQQKEIAEKLNISQQLITELKKNRKGMSIETLSSFIREYPLLFWYEYLTN